MKSLVVPAGMKTGRARSYRRHVASRRVLRLTGRDSPSAPLPPRVARIAIDEREVYATRVGCRPGSHKMRHTLRLTVPRGRVSYKLGSHDLRRVLGHSKRRHVRVNWCYVALADWSIVLERAAFFIQAGPCLSAASRVQQVNKGFHVGDAHVKKLTPMSKMCDRYGLIILHSPLGVMLNFDARVKNSDAAQPRVTNVKTPNGVVPKHKPPPTRPEDPTRDAHRVQQLQVWLTEHGSMFLKVNGVCIARPTERHNSFVPPAPYVVERDS